MCRTLQYRIWQELLCSSYSADVMTRRPVCGRAAQWHGCCTALARTTTGCLLQAHASTLCAHCSSTTALG
eukprot:9563-Heterococcus_DN1.PRE.1